MFCYSKNCLIPKKEYLERKTKVKVVALLLFSTCCENGVCINISMAVSVLTLLGPFHFVEKCGGRGLSSS
jgi:hypothetical protein